MKNEQPVKVLMTGPENDPSISLGGIVTVVNMILQNSGQEIVYFNRDMGDRRKGIVFLKKLFRLRSLLRKTTFDLFHFHFSFDPRSLRREALYIRLAKRTKRPVIVHLHGGVLLFEKKESKLVDWILAIADKIVVLSDIEKESLVKLYAVPADKIIILRNCIDLKEIPAFTTARQPQQKLIFFGRLHESKGIGEIVEACQQLTKQQVNVSLDVYGSGPDQQWFTAAMNDIPGMQFNYKGLVWGEKKWHALQDADIFLLPSRYGEGLPMALLEAMALGKVVIVTDDASITRVVKHGQNGLLVPKKSAERLAQEIARIIAAPAEQSMLGNNARKTIEQEYSSDYYIHTLDGIYHNLLKP
jgi:glycosyltransferase involved in cell wall biosynthesis